MEGPGDDSGAAVGVTGNRDWESGDNVVSTAREEYNGHRLTPRTDIPKPGCHPALSVYPTASSLGLDVDGRRTTPASSQSINHLPRMKYLPARLLTRSRPSRISRGRVPLANPSCWRAESVV